MYTATYSPDDNKLRLYAEARLDPETYARVRGAGFIWAPTQKLFVAPTWTPDREDLLMELAGDIGDEDTSLVDRAEERAERFEDYSEKRAEDATRAHAYVSSIADGIPLGQPILVGHHSERHARKDAERIENGMRRAVKMWKTSQYWTSRAKGAISHAKYKERPDVRARRIKGIEADKRKRERSKAEAADIIRKFELVDQPEKWKAREDGSIATREERAAYIAGRIAGAPNVATVTEDGPRGPVTFRFTPYDVLRPTEERYQHCPAMSVDEVIAKLRTWRAGVDAYADRWIEHYENRLTYERAMLAEAGGLITDRSAYPIVVGGRVLVRGEWVTVRKVNVKDGRIVSLSTNRRYVSVVGIEEVKDYTPPTAEEAQAAKASAKLPPMVNVDEPGAIHMTQAEYTRLYTDSKYAKQFPTTETRGRYRQRHVFKGGKVTPVFLTDAKVAPYPAPGGAAPVPLPAPERVTPPRQYVPPAPTVFDAMAESLRAGVAVVSAPQLFPTPPEVARRVVELADIQSGECVLEPSAGTGNLVQAVIDSGVDTEILAYEINQALCSQLARKHPSYRVQVRQADFLEVTDFQGQYPKIIMNPPFKDGADIKHILHARTFLKPGGRLVAICANGPRQAATLQPIADSWEELPAGTFAGTGVRAVLLTMGAES